MKVGIFFGGRSREREISFAGGRTVYDNLDKALFEPVPVFVDSLGNFILLDWQFIYKGTIRDFYPPTKHAHSQYGFQLYAEHLGGTDADWNELISEVGRKITPDDFKSLMDFAFLALHGPYGEDGSIQGILEWYGIPYSGAGILPSAIGIDKTSQSKLIEAMGFPRPKSYEINYYSDIHDLTEEDFAYIKDRIGFPLVIKAAQQGSSIGVSVFEGGNAQELQALIERAFFEQRVAGEQWRKRTELERKKFVAELIDIRSGIGLPADVLSSGAEETTTIYHPDGLFNYLNFHLLDEEAEYVHIWSKQFDRKILIEEFIEGKEFSCIVIEDEGGIPIALPPTGIVKGGEVFDYRAKYLPGISRKVTPIDLPTEQINDIRDACCDLYEKLCMNVYARIDGFITDQGTVFLNDPNTTSGMLPSSFFFHQAAEIGLSPSQFLTYIIQSSLASRELESKLGQSYDLFASLDEALAEKADQSHKAKRVGVIMGGWSTERHISVESGRNVFEKLASSQDYEPVPIFLTGSPDAHALYILPIHIMLKDHADDIREKIQQALDHPRHEAVLEIVAEAHEITEKYAGQVKFGPIPLTYEQLAEHVDEVFIALHGRPGEDGQVQERLEKLGIPYNGSSPESAALTIDKYRTNALLREHGFHVAGHALVEKTDWEKSQDDFLDQIEAQFAYPLIAKPHDDGCSSAVKLIQTRQELAAYSEQIFRKDQPLLFAPSEVLKLSPKEEFPIKDCYLIESLIQQGDAAHFMEITGGFLTHHTDRGIRYEMFEASEALASKGILSLEEKFLAGEGQNITPARYASDPIERQRISDAVKDDLKRAAQLLQIEGYARIDAFVKIGADDSVETWIIEVNSLPGMTPATAIFHQAAINGYKPYEFIDQVLKYGREKLANR